MRVVGKTRTKIKTPRNITAGFFLPSHAAGARISSNSWGARNGSYIRESRDMDAFVHEYPDFLPVFASGNYGQKGFQSVVAPSSAKKSILKRNFRALVGCCTRFLPNVCFLRVVDFVCAVHYPSARCVAVA